MPPYLTRIAADAYLVTHDRDVTAVTVGRQPLGHHVAKTDDYGCAFHLPSRTLAVGYWYGPNIDLVDFRTGSTATIESPKESANLTWDAGGEHLCVISRGKLRVLDRRGRQLLEVGNLGSPNVETGYLRSSSSLLVPTRRKGEVRIIDLSNVTARQASLDVGSKFFPAIAAPTDDSWILLDGRRGVHSVSVDSLELRWSIDLRSVVSKRKGHTATGFFTGDGQLFVVGVSELHGSSYIVLDARNGEIMDDFNDDRLKGFIPTPLEGDWVVNRFLEEDGVTAMTFNIRTKETGSVRLFAP